MISNILFHRMCTDITDWSIKNFYSIETHFFSIFFTYETWRFFNYLFVVAMTFHKTFLIITHFSLILSILSILLSIILSLYCLYTVCFLRSNPMNISSSFFRFNPNIDIEKSVNNILTYWQITPIDNAFLLIKKPEPKCKL